MLDHITIQVADLKKSKAFYEKTLAALGMSIVLGNDAETFWGFGKEEPVFEIVQSTPQRPAHQKVHVAFKAPTKESIDAWYAAAIEAGATDNGKPGPRPEYTPTYYAAFVIDPDGNNIEACVH